MNKKVIGIVLILLGGYLAIGNTIASMIFNYAGPIGFVVPISPVNYWANWFTLYGPMTILVAVIGILLIKYGISILKRNKAIIREIK
jgi:Ca2+/Na+ antiporter